jgi:hypothetical protein
MKNKIIKLPISSHTRLKNTLGKLSVPCIVSPRWLKFHSESSGPFEEGEYVIMDVMTSDKNDKDKKICELVITKEDILSAINAIKKTKRSIVDPVFRTMV